MSTDPLALARQAEEQGEAWNSDLDEAIAECLGWQKRGDDWHAVGDFFDDGRQRITSYAVELPAFTRSLDATMLLLEPPRYPLWTMRLDIRSFGARGYGFAAELTTPGREARGWSRHRPALAVCAAALRARSWA